MFRPKILMIGTGGILLLFLAIFWLVNTSAFRHRSSIVIHQIRQKMDKPKNITAIFVDVTDSDTGRAWKMQPFREQFIYALNSCLVDSRDIMSVYLIHGKTIDVQPFWTNSPLFPAHSESLADSASFIMLNHQKQQCLEAFDSLSAGMLMRNANALDSQLTELTDIFGAFQQAALHFRMHANSSKDSKRIFFLSDAKENAGISDGNVKLNHLNSIKSTRVQAEKAFVQVMQSTDIKDELRYCDVYFLSPNNRLYFNEERNLRRIFWEELLVNKLNCAKVYFF